MEEEKVRQKENTESYGGMKRDVVWGGEWFVQCSVGGDGKEEPKCAWFLTQC